MLNWPLKSRNDIDDSPTYFWSNLLRFKREYYEKGRSRISMVWVPPLEFDPYCEVKRLPLQDKSASSINSNKIFLQKLWTNFEKSKNLISSKTAQPILMTKIYVIEGAKEVLKQFKNLFNTRLDLSVRIKTRIRTEVT